MVNGDKEPGSEQAERIIAWLRDEVLGHPLLLFGLIVIVGLLFMAPTMIFQVDRDEQGVKMRFGDFQQTLPPGLHFKFPPPIESVVIVNTERVFTEEFGYRSRETPQGTKRDRSQYRNESLILTGDLAVARVEWEIHYRRENPRNVVFNVKNEKSVLRDASEAALRRIVGDWDATKVITSARQKIAQEVRSQLQELMDRYQSGITIDDVELQATEPPSSSVQKAFEAVDGARQEREQLRLEAERERTRVLNETEGEVEERLGNTRGRVATIRNEAKGDAERFNEVLASYEAAPEVTRTRLYLDSLEAVLNDSNRVYIVDPEVPGVLPHMDLKGNGNLTGGGQSNQ